MKFIHVKDIGSNFYPMYSVEWLPKNSQHNCWNQHGLTSHKKVARLLAFEVWLRGRGRNHRRVRVL